MATKTFGVGFIGVEPNRSWAARAHIPAIQAMPDRFRLAGIANSTAESARKAADAVGVERAFADGDELITSPDVDIVAVTVKVPAHYQLVVKALSAGKHVYCEWPLGKDLDEALKLDQLARERGVQAVVGTQALRAPAVRYAKDLVAQGFVGDVLSITLIGTGGNWGAEMSLANAYCLDVSNGATMLSIPFGHTVAALQDIFGEVESVSAELDLRRKIVKITETGEERSSSAPDQILVAARFRSGVPLSAHYRGGANAGSGLLLEINGTAGNLQITAPVGHMQLAPLDLSGAQGASMPLQPLSIPEQYAPLSDLKGPAANVGAVYADLYSDLTMGTHHAPTFSDGVRTHRLLDAIARAANTGTRQLVQG
jgi:predicted dehydrogenase